MLDVSLNETVALWIVGRTGYMLYFPLCSELSEWFTGELGTIVCHNLLRSLKNGTVIFYGIHYLLAARCCREFLNQWEVAVPVHCE